MTLPSWRRSSGWNTLLGNSLARVCRQQCQSPCVPWSGAGPSSRTKPGNFLVLIPVTNRCSGWMEIVPVLVLHSDNGSEFINDELRRFCDAHGIRFTRSRPYHKNDNCYVESKNWTLYAGAWDTDGLIRRVSSQTFSSWRPCLLSVPTSSSPPWPSSRRSGQEAGFGRGIMLPRLLCTGSCASWAPSTLSPCSGTSGSCRHGSSGRPARISPSRP